MNTCSIWPFAQISDDFYYLDILQCGRYFVAALFKKLALITMTEMCGLESRSRTSRSRSRLLWKKSRSRLEIWIRSQFQRLRSRLHPWCSPQSLFIWNPYSFQTELPALLETTLPFFVKSNTSQVFILSSGVFQPTTTWSQWEYVFTMFITLT